MDMVTITACDVMDCVYNRNRRCHTPAITVGSSEPMCESYMRPEGAVKEGGDDATRGAVGACHVGDCLFNSSLECHAPGIKVGRHSGHADCMTYYSKK